jgi:hypothetical protein
LHRASSLSVWKAGGTASIGEKFERWFACFAEKFFLPPTAVISSVGDVISMAMPPVVRQPVVSILRHPVFLLQ